MQVESLRKLISQKYPNMEFMVRNIKIKIFNLNLYGLSIPLKTLLMEMEITVRF